MNEVHLSTRLASQGAGGVRRDIGSQAGDGFKALFHNLLKSAPAGESDTSNLDQAQSSQELAFEESSSPEFDNRTNDISEGEADDTASFPEGEIAIDDSADALENGSTELTEEQVTDLIEEVKSLLKDPKTAAKVLAILEKAGVDVAKLNDADLRKALESLSLPARRELAKVLKTENPGLTEDTMPQVLSEALGQMRQEFRQAAVGEEAPEARANGTQCPEGSMADAFLEASGAEVTAAEEPSVLDTIGDKAGEVLEDLVNLVVSTETPASAEAPVPATVGTDLASMTFMPAMAATAAFPGATAAPSQGSTAAETPALSALNRAEKALKGAVSEQAQPRSTLVSDMEKSKMLQRLMAQARMHLNNGEGRFQIRMEPAHLGQMRVTIENLGGVVSATILTESESAKQALQHQLGDLKNALAEQGVQVGKFGVLSDPKAFGGSGSQGNPWQEQMDRHQRKASSRQVAAAARRNDINSDMNKETA